MEVFPTKNKPLGRYLKNMGFLTAFEVSNLETALL